MSLIRYPMVLLVAALNGGHGLYAQVDSTSLSAVDTSNADGTAAGKERTALRTQGRVELGGVYGLLPFASEGTATWNAFLRGRVSTAVLGLPVGLEFDLGTNTPKRGQRNSLRLMIEPKRLLEQERWNDARTLHRLDVLRDSLMQVKAQLDRTVAGLSAQASAPTLPAGEAPILAMDSLPPTPDLAIPDTIGHEAPATADGLTAAEKPGMDLHEAQEALRSVEAQVNEVDRQLSLAKAMSQVHDQATAHQGRLLQGFRRLELGTCYPKGTEFLLNGTSFQGISTEYMHRDLFLAVDQGRSFDDAWMNTDPVANQLQRLQQSLFLVDAKDLNPKRLTAVRAGYGPSDGTHLHVGYLYGRRQDLPLGVDSTSATTTTLTNQVLELNGALEVANGHQVRGAFARSIVQAALTGENGDAPEARTGDLFSTTGPAQSAATLGWSSNFRRSGTSFELNGKAVQDHFQSYGVAFLRTGTHTLDTRVDQRIGTKLRVRARYTREERRPTGASVPHPGTLDRAQLMLTYRPSTALGLRVNHLPVRTVAWAGDTAFIDNNSMTGCGVSWRARKGTTVATVDSDLSYFTGISRSGQQAAQSATVNLLVRHDERWSVGGGWSRFVTKNGERTTNMENVSLRADLSTDAGLTLQAGAQWPNTGTWGASFAIAQRLTKDWTAQLRAERLARPDLLMLPPGQGASAANCSFSVTHTW